MLGLALAAQAQAGKTYRIGFLGAESAAYDRSRVDLVRARLGELGYVQSSILIETRFADGNYGRLPTLAAELAGLKVDVLIASGTKAGIAAKNATTTIPVVVSNMGDALGAGFVASYARPGGNVTGMSLLSPEVVVKQLELLRFVRPNTPKVAVLVNPANPNTKRIVENLRREAKVLQVALEPLEARNAAEIEDAFATMARQHIDALVVQGETLFVAHAKAIAARATRERIASAGTFDYVHAGGLIGYSTNRMEAWRHLVTYVDKILKGAKPADLPVEQPTTNELVVNLATAKALGLTLPSSILLRADKTIQ